MFYLDKKTVHLSHSDMDGSGCAIISKAAGLDRDVFRITYTNIEDTLDNILEMRKTHRQILISDLMFTERDFKLLSHLSTSFDQIIFIDHHSYEFNPKDYETDNLKIIVNTKACATKLLYAFFKNEGEVQRFNKFVNIVNAYDICLKDSEYFELSKDYNRLFWNLGSKSFEYNFYKKPELDDIMKKRIEKIHKEIKDYFNNNKDKIMFDDYTVVSFLDEYLSEIKDFYPDQKVLINLKNNGHYSVRIDDDIDDEKTEKIKNIFCNKLFEKIQLFSAGGHLHAFGITTRNMELFEHKEKIQKMVKVVEKVLND